MTAVTAVTALAAFSAFSVAVVVAVWNAPGNVGHALTLALVSALPPETGLGQRVSAGLCKFARSLFDVRASQRQA